MSPSDNPVSGRVEDEGQGGELDSDDLLPPPEVIERLRQMKEGGRLPSLEQLFEALRGTPLDPRAGGER